MTKEWYELYIGGVLLEKYSTKQQLLDAFKELMEEGHNTLTLHYCTRKELVLEL